jgi:hypothetical protein
MTKVTAGFHIFANAHKNPCPVSNVTPAVRAAALNAMKRFKMTAAAACWGRRTANGALRHAVDTLCVGVLYFQNVTECHCACHYNRTSYIAFIVTKLSLARERCVKNSCTKSHEKTTMALVAESRYLKELRTDGKKDGSGLDVGRSFCYFETNPQIWQLNR